MCLRSESAGGGKRGGNTGFTWRYGADDHPGKSRGGEGGSSASPCSSGKGKQVLQVEHGIFLFIWFQGASAQLSECARHTDRVGKQESSVTTRLGQLRGQALPRMTHSAPAPQQGSSRSSWSSRASLSPFFSCIYRSKKDRGHHVPDLHRSTSACPRCAPRLLRPGLRRARGGVTRGRYQQERASPQKLESGLGADNAASAEEPAPPERDRKVAASPPLAPGKRRQGRRSLPSRGPQAPGGSALSGGGRMLNADTEPPASGPAPSRRVQQTTQKRFGGCDGWCCSPACPCPAGRAPPQGRRKRRRKGRGCASAVRYLAPPGGGHSAAGEQPPAQLPREGRHRPPAG